MTTDRERARERAERARDGLVARWDAEEFVLVEPEPMHVGWVGRIVDRVVRLVRRG